MKKILHVGMSSNYGGIEQVIYSLCMYKNNKEYEFSFINIGKDKIAYEEEFNKKFIIFNITPRYENYRKYLKELKILFKENDFDIIHFHLMTYSIFDLYLIAKKYSKAKIIIHNHADKKYIRTCTLKTKILDSIGNKICKGDCNIACSENVDDKFLKRNNTKIIYNGIDIERYKYKLENRNDIRKKLNVKQDETLYGNVGLICKNKNQIKTLKIFENLLNENPKSKILFIGKKTDYKELYEYIENCSYKEKIIIKENVKNIEKYYSAMDCFIFNSYSEGLGIVLIEARANGLITFASNKIYIKSLEKIGVNYINDDLDNMKLASKILENYPYKRYENNKEIKIFTYENMINEVYKVWEEICQKK